MVVALFEVLRRQFKNPPGRVVRCSIDPFNRSLQVIGIHEMTLTYYGLFLVSYYSYPQGGHLPYLRGEIAVKSIEVLLYFRIERIRVLLIGYYTCFSLDLHLMTLFREERQWCNNQRVQLKFCPKLETNLYNCFIGFLEREWGCFRYGGLEFAVWICSSSGFGWGRDNRRSCSELS
jgi:hypothetical protein